MTVHAHICKALVLGTTVAAATVLQAIDGFAQATELRAVHSAILREAFRRAALEAQRKLARRECREVFHDFRDLAGKPLTDTLDRFDVTPEAFFGRLLFVDGTGAFACESHTTLALTSPGNHAITICASFGPIALRDVSYAADVLIHEELHALGLGENPPASTAITFRARSRCDLE